MHEQEPVKLGQIIHPQAVGDVALSGAVECVGLVDPGLRVIVRDHRGEPKKPAVPDFLNGHLLPENQAWLTEQRQKEKDWRRRQAAARYA